MATLKEKGHNLNLTNIVIHKINKLAREKKSVLIKAKKELIISQQEKKFLADVRESFSKKSVPTHGVFENTFQYNEFQKNLKYYRDGKIDFMTFTVNSMDYYKRIIENSAPATGGFMIFADFKVTDSGNDRYILVLSINNKHGYNLSETALSIQAIQNIELHKMDLASFINVSRWELSDNGDTSIKTYLTFIRGKKALSDYFQNFIGCADKTTASESSRLLLNTMETYIKYKNINADKAKEIKSRVSDYCHDCNKRKAEILLSRISNIFDEDDTDAFLLYATDESIGNGEVVKYDPKVMRTLKYVDYQSEDLTLRFNKTLLGRSIKINKDKTTITISHIPDKLKEQL